MHPETTTGRFVIKLAALGTFCGGPLVVFDALEPHLGTNPAFLVVYAPVCLMIFGALSLGDDLREGFSRIVVQASLVAAAVVVASNGYGVYHLATHPRRADGELIVLGLVVGTACSVVYAGMAFRHLPEYPS